jgi:hypothetical protein
MATQQIKWLPSGSPNVIAYEILKSDTGKDGPYTLLIQVLHQIPGSNWNTAGGYFFLNDEEIIYRYYRIRVLDRYGNIAEDEAPTPFKAGNNPVVVPSLSFVALQENTGGVNALQYVSRGGTPIGNANIRVYKKIDYDLRNLSRAIGTTITNANGGWINPICVEPGETYTIVYHKVNEYGPDTIEVTV